MKSSPNSTKVTNLNLLEEIETINLETKCPPFLVKIISQLPPNDKAEFIQALRDCGDVGPSNIDLEVS